MKNENPEGSLLIFDEEPLDEEPADDDPRPKTESRDDEEVNDGRKTLEDSAVDAIINRLGQTSESLENGDWAALVADCPTLDDIKGEESRILDTSDLLRKQIEKEAADRFQSLITSTITALASQLTSYISRIRLDPKNIKSEVASVNFVLQDAGIYDATGALACPRGKTSELTQKIRNVLTTQKGGYIVESASGYDATENKDTFSIVVKTR